MHHVGQRKALDRLRFTKVSLLWVQLCVCVCVCVRARAHVCVGVCAWADNRSDSKLQFSAHPPTHFAVEDSSLSPLSALTNTFFSSNIHITLFFVSLYIFYTDPTSIYHYVTVCSLSFPFSLVPFSLYSMFLHLFLLLLFFQEPQTTVIHNPVDRKKVHIIPLSWPILDPLCHSPPYPHVLLPSDPSFFDASVWAHHGVGLLLCVCVCVCVAWD